MSEKYGSKAIKTEYKGITFKSMIEAKYAQKFDELGLKWEYEPKNYMLSNGLNYMPDFHFIGTDTYFEVKGVKDWSEIPGKDCWKLDGFQNDFPEKTLILGDSTGYFNVPYMLHDWHLFNENDDTSYDRAWKWNDVLRFGDDKKRPHPLWQGVYLVQCGHCDKPYFENPWCSVQKNKTYCPNCSSPTINLGWEDDGDYEFHREWKSMIWRPRNLFSGSFQFSNYYDCEAE